jgi:3-hydroxymyristoyl/3-hydroxydecanoyl-(acyl carrier protein) dehydratase
VSTSGATTAAVRLDAPARVAADARTRSTAEPRAAMNASAAMDSRADAAVAQLRAQPTVADARVEIVDGAACVLVAPTAAGRSRLRGHGWLTLAEDLERAIAPLRVRAWRFVERVEATLASVSDAVLAPLPATPDVLATHRESPTSVTLTLRVPLDVAVCREHFPRAPIVPGVVQLGWAESYARSLLSLEGRFVALEVVKFHHVVQPGDTLELHLDWLAADRRLKLHGTTHHGRVLSGRMVFTAP